MHETESNAGSVSHDKPDASEKGRARRYIPSRGLVVSTQTKIRRQVQTDGSVHGNEPSSPKFSGPALIACMFTPESPQRVSLPSDMSGKLRADRYGGVCARLGRIPYSIADERKGCAQVAVAVSQRGFLRIDDHRDYGHHVAKLSPYVEGDAHRHVLPTGGSAMWRIF